MMSAGLLAELVLTHLLGQILIRTNHGSNKIVDPVSLTLQAVLTCKINEVVVAMK